VDDASRNGGRALAVVVMSGDNKQRTALRDYAELTKSTLEGWGWDTAQWPADAAAALNSGGVKAKVVRTDDRGEFHEFVLIDCGSLDLLLGVSSRREQNVPGVGSGNVATNVLLDVLRTPDPDDAGRPLYGVVLVEDISRVFRHEIGVAILQQHFKDWAVLLRSRTDTLDYSVPTTAFLGVIRGSQTAEQATYLIANGSKHKQVAHTNLHLKFAPGQTHPLVAVDFRTRRMSYDEDVVVAIRRAVRLLREGRTMRDVAEEVGSSIPAVQARQAPDVGDTPRSREARNALRVAQGLPELPMRFLDDGTPNPAYVGETIADLRDPAGRLRELLVSGPTVTPRHADGVRASLGSGLIGVAPEDAFLAFYETGVYRRLVKDHGASNSQITRWYWCEADLGRTADGEFVLTRDDVVFLKSLRTGRSGGGSWGEGPLVGVFRVNVPTSLYTSKGVLDLDAGRLVARSARYVDGGGVCVWHEPVGATPRGAACSVVGRLSASAIGIGLSNALIAACSEVPEAASFSFDAFARRANPLVALKEAVANLEHRHEAAVQRLLDPDLSEGTIDAVKRQLRHIESDLQEAQRAVATFDEDATPQCHDDTFDISDLATLAAILRLDRPLPPQHAHRTARMLKALLPDATLRLDPAAGSIEVTATLTIRSLAGALAIPLAMTLRNEARDTWLAGVAGGWWGGRGTVQDLMRERGLATATSTRWCEPIADRLLGHAADLGRPLRGPNLAMLIARCPDLAALSTIRRAIDEGTNDRDVADFLHAGGDVRKGIPWTEAAQGTRWR